MKIVILNGSPKGKYSVTLHSCLYIQKLFPEHEYEILHVGQQIKKYEKDMAPALEALKSADLVLFSYPVYTFLVPSQLHRFIELVKASGLDLSGKFATQISTSKHFYDTTAHRFIQDNCADMGMKYIKGLSSDMEDLPTEKGQAETRKFFEYVCHCMSEDLFEAPSVSGASEVVAYGRAFEPREKESDKATVIVADLAPDDSALAAMIDDFIAVYPHKTHIINIREFKFDGGCLGCFNCAGDGKCIYRDGFDSFLREQIQTASSTVFAFSVRDHSMGSLFKTYDDREFCNGHRTVTMGMPMGYIVCGKLEKEENLRTVIEARAEVGRNFLCGIGTDAKGIADMAKRMDFAIKNEYVQPQNFYGVGGMKIFRDLIYVMRGLMREDHRFYKKHRLYDFPQKKRGTMIGMMLVGAMMNNKKIRAKIGGSMNDGMIMNHKKVVDAAKPIEK